MKAIILAAGQGTRLRSVTGKRCKCLLSFDGRTILDRQIDAVFDAGATELGIVVGYGKEQIIGQVRQQHPDLMDRIEFITNPNFAFTNNMYSLWRAKSWLGEDSFVCLNADVLFDPRMLPAAVQTEADVSVVIDREYRAETTKIVLRNDRVVELRKTITPRECDGTFIGIATFSGVGAQLLFAAAEPMFAAGEKKQFYNDVLHRLAGVGMRIDYTETEGLPWAEIDDAADLRFAQSLQFSGPAALAQAV